MTISELVKALEEIQEKYGDVEVLRRDECFSVEIDEYDVSYIDVHKEVVIG